jgi:hypothetical protein
MALAAPKGIGRATQEAARAGEEKVADALL